MAIKTYEELSARERALAAALDLADGDPPSGPGRISATSVRGRRYRSYEQLFQVVHGVPLARVSSVRLAFRTGSGTQTVCGVADVVTRPDATRRGYARSLLRETHRRARKGGVRWSFLWTRRSWGAHRAYELEGYRDVFSIPIAYRQVPPASPRASPRREFTFRKARSNDAGRLEGLLRRSTAARVGFVPREAGLFATRFRIRFRRPEDFWILSRHRAVVGYAHLTKDEFDVACREAIVADERAGAAMIEALERVAEGRWLSYTMTTFAPDHREALTDRGYLFLDRTHGVLMAAPLTPRARAEWPEVERAARDPAFSVHNGDMF